MLRRMRLVAVSIVKNEADIIEPFVRHTLEWVDHHFLFDHDSTDGTREILGALKAEGCPITLFTDDALANLQQARSNRLSRLAAETQAADWILPLDADEILIGPGRAQLEQALALVPLGQAATVPLLNYFSTPEDDAKVNNPVVRLRYAQAAPATTRKIIVPRSLALDPQVEAGKGSHALYRAAQSLPSHPLPAEFYLAHLALRSPEHQMLRVVLAELQKLSRGRAHHGLDLHYRLGFQLLAEKPEVFFATASQPAAAGRLAPIDYRGGDLRYTGESAGWNRAARAMLSFLEKLAVSHGQLLDSPAQNGQTATDRESVIRELAGSEVARTTMAGSDAAFSGFTPLSGWEAAGAPVPEAFLPRYHWTTAPSTELSIVATVAKSAELVAEALTYCDDQRVAVYLNDACVLQFHFPRINQKEFLVAPLALRAGENRLSFRYSKDLVTLHDPRRLALIFLSLRVLDAAAP
ncbi:MAG: hypothetical protein JWM32_1386 [Verrucomicrobia bacterium]|nr:hypothetical protein [Verrucomicrobiota bacterium]